MPNDTPDQPDAPEGIHSRLARAQLEIGAMAPDKHVQIRTEKANYDFDYVSKSALLIAARRTLSPLGIAMIVTEEAIQQDGNRCRVTLRVTLACDGGEVSAVRSAYGNDPFDKGPQKAGTTALRLALGDLLMQGGEEGDTENEAIEFRPHVRGQALVEGDRPATTEQLKYATDLIYRAQLDKAMPTAAHALLRLARPIAQSEIGPGLEVPDAIRLIPQPVMSKLIERLTQHAETPKAARLVWVGVAEWEGANGYSASVEPEDTKLPDPPAGNALGPDGQELPF